jgi:hypothetical protein
MKVTRIRKGLALVIAASALGLGCELIVDFDRTKIPVEGTDATPQPTPDATIDTGIDTGKDAPVDSPAEAAPDAAADAPDDADPDADQ